jgi:hypothetical protein
MLDLKRKSPAGLQQQLLVLLVGGVHLTPAWVAVCRSSCVLVPAVLHLLSLQAMLQMLQQQSYAQFHPYCCHQPALHNHHLNPSCYCHATLPQQHCCCLQHTHHLHTRLAAAVLRLLPPTHPPADH